MGISFQKNIPSLSGHQALVFHGVTNSPSWHNIVSPISDGSGGSQAHGTFPVPASVCRIGLSQGRYVSPSPQSIISSQTRSSVSSQCLKDEPSSPNNLDVLPPEVFGPDQSNVEGSLTERSMSTNLRDVGRLPTKFYVLLILSELPKFSSFRPAALS